jgi:hypothetical protein
MNPALRYGFLSVSVHVEPISNQMTHAEFQIIERFEIHGVKREQEHKLIKVIHRVVTKSMWISSRRDRTQRVKEKFGARVLRDEVSDVVMDTTSRYVIFPYVVDSTTDQINIGLLDGLSVAVRIP